MFTVQLRGYAALILRLRSECSDLAPASGIGGSVSLLFELSNKPTSYPCSLELVLPALSGAPIRLMYRISAFSVPRLLPGCLPLPIRLQLRHCGFEGAPDASATSPFRLVLSHRISCSTVLEIDTDSATFSFTQMACRFGFWEVCWFCIYPASSIRLRIPVLLNLRLEGATACIRRTYLIYKVTLCCSPLDL